MTVSAADSLLSAAESGVSFLEWEWSGSEQMLDGVEQSADRVTRCGIAEIIGSDVQIDLRASDQSMTEHIADGDQANTGAH